MGNAGLYLAHNFPDHQEIRIVRFRITEEPLYSTTIVPSRIVFLKEL